MAVDYTKYYRGYKYMQELLQDDFTYNYINENLHVQVLAVVIRQAPFTAHQLYCEDREGRPCYSE